MKHCLSIAQYNGSFFGETLDRRALEQWTANLTVLYKWFLCLHKPIVTVELHPGHHPGLGEYCNIMHEAGHQVELVLCINGNDNNLVFLLVGTEFDDPNHQALQHKYHVYGLLSQPSADLVMQIRKSLIAEAKEMRSSPAAESMRYAESLELGSLGAIHTALELLAAYN